MFDLGVFSWAASRCHAMHAHRIQSAAAIRWQALPPLPGEAHSGALSSGPMGENKNRRDAFGRWYQARGKGQQYLLCLIPFAVATAAMMLIIPLLPESEPAAAEWGLKPPCPNSRVPIAQDDPLLDMNDLEGTIHRVCARAGDPR